MFNGFLFFLLYFSEFVITNSIKRIVSNLKLYIKRLLDLSHIGLCPYPSGWEVFRMSFDAISLLSIFLLIFLIVIFNFLKFYFCHILLLYLFIYYYIVERIIFVFSFFHSVHIDDVFFMLVLYFRIRFCLRHLYCNK